ncbi:MAG: hypothetical protein WCE66_07380, partial [Azonexus sp.]
VTGFGVQSSPAQAFQIVPVIGTAANAFCWQLPGRRVTRCSTHLMFASEQTAGMNTSSLISGVEANAISSCFLCSIGPLP